MPLLSTAISYLIPLDTGEDSVRPVLPTTCLIPLSRLLTLNPLPSYLTPHPSYPTPSLSILLHSLLSHSIPSYPTPHPSYPIHTNPFSPLQASIALPATAHAACFKYSVYFLSYKPSSVHIDSDADSALK